MLHVLHHSFPTRRSSDLRPPDAGLGGGGHPHPRAARGEWLGVRAGRQAPARSASGLHLSRDDGGPARLCDAQPLSRRGAGAFGWHRQRAFGGAGGAAVGAVVPGLSTVEGAAIGAAGGAVVGALDKDDEGRQWYRDEYGNRYYIDKDGRRRYD